MRKSKTLTIWILGLLILARSALFFPGMPETQATDTPSLALPFEINAINNRTDYLINQFYKIAPAAGCRGNDYHWFLGNFEAQPERLTNILDVFSEWSNSTNWFNATESSGSNRMETGRNETMAYIRTNYYNYPLTATKVYNRWSMKIGRDVPFIEFHPSLYFYIDMNGAVCSQNMTFRFGYNETFRPTKVIISNITEPYSFSDPASTQWLSLVNSSNSAALDDNYAIFYTNSTDDIVCMMSFSKKPLDLGIRENTDCDYIDFVRYMQNVTAPVGSRNIERHGDRIFISFFRMDTTISVPELKDALDEWAHYSLARITGITDSVLSWDGECFTVNRTIAFSDETHDWSFDVPHFIPSPPHSIPTSPTATDLRYNGTFTADLYYVNATSWATFTLKADGETIDHPAYCRERAKGVVDFLKLNTSEKGLWDGGSWISYVNGSSRNYAYAGDIQHGLLEYRRYFGDTSMDDYIVTAMNERIVNSPDTLGRDYMLAYKQFGNASYLQKAEESANNANQSGTWSTLYVDRSIWQLVDLYLETGNETYHDWGKMRCEYGIPRHLDVSQSAHNTRGVAYYLWKIGDDIDGTNLTDWCLKRMRELYLWRSTWSGLWRDGGTGCGRFYEVYSCHQDFAATAILIFTQYLVENDKELSPMYLSMLHDIKEWFYGNNILSENMINAEGAVRRKIEYNETLDQVGIWEDTYEQKPYSYDQGNYLFAWVWYAELIETMMSKGVLPQSQLNFRYYPSKTFSYSATDPYMTYSSGSITSYTAYSDDKLSFQVSATETSITKIYCGSEGEPTDVTGTTLWSYNNETGIATINVLDTGLKDITVFFAEETHDVAVTAITLSRTVVGQGYPMQIEVTVQNQGNLTETFNITCYANATIIQTQTATDLASGGTTVIAFAWNTTGIAYGTYTVSAVADTIPEETDTTDNYYTDGTVLVTIAGDVNGDQIVNVIDLTIVSLAYGSFKGEPNYNPVADINEDGIVDMRDLVIVARNLGKNTNLT